MYGCWNHALILSGDATRTWAFAAGPSTDFDAAAWAAWADSLAWLSVAAEDALSHVSTTTYTAAHTAPLCDAARPVGARSRDTSISLSWGQGGSGSPTNA